MTPVTRPRDYQHCSVLLSSVIISSKDVMMLTQFISVIRKTIRIGLIGSCSGAIAGASFGILVGLSFSFVVFLDSIYPYHGLATIQKIFDLYIYLPAILMMYGCLLGTIIGSIPGVIVGYVLAWSGKIAHSPQWGTTVGGLIGLAYPTIVICVTLTTTPAWTAHARSELVEGVFSLPLLTLFGVITGWLGGRVFRYWANKYLT